jgi:hypothetical protein
MNIGDQVLFDGRVYVLRGLDPMSVSDREALLEETVDRPLVRVPLKDVEPLADRSGFESEGLG